MRTITVLSTKYSLQGVTGVQAYIGLEQEFFFVPRDAYYKRTDLQMAGRTIMGKMPPRSQEVCDHCKSDLGTAICPASYV